MMYPNVRAKNASDGPIAVSQYQQNPPEEHRTAMTWVLRL